MMDNVHGSTPPGPALLSGLPEDFEGWLTFSPELKELAADAAILAPPAALALVVGDWQTRSIKGQAPPAEVYLELCQDWCQDEYAWQLVRTELEMAVSSGGAPTLETYLQRLPQWAPELEQWFSQNQAATAEPATIPIDAAPRGLIVDDTLRMGGRDKTVRGPLMLAKATVQAVPTFEPGEVIAGYRILSALSTQPGIACYRAFDVERRLDVELSVPARTYASGASDRKRVDNFLTLCRELQASGGVAAHYSGWEGEMPFVAVECERGETLAARVQRGETNVAAGVSCVAQIAKTLAIVHRRGTECVGPTPETIWIDEQGNAQLNPAAIFGGDAADPVAEDSSWRALETLAPTRRSTARSDVYALGAILQYSLSGQVPQTARERSASESSAAKGLLLAEPWKGIAERAMALDSKARYSNADDLATELEAQAEQRQLLASLVVPGVVSLAIVVLVAVAGWMWNAGWWPL